MILLPIWFVFDGKKGNPFYFISTEHTTEPRKQTRKKRDRFMVRILKNAFSADYDVLRKCVDSALAEK